MIRRERTVQIHKPADDEWGRMIFRESGFRWTHFVLNRRLADWGMEEGKQYRITVEEVDTGEYI